VPANAKLVRGATGPAVRELQRLLANAGLYSAASIDGSFGPVTQKAVRAFQEQRGLPVDGWAGPETMAKLRGVSSPPAAPLRGTRAAHVQTALDFGMSVLGCKYAAVNPFRFGDVRWDGGAHRSINGSGTVWQYPAGTRVFDCSGLVVACFRRAGVDLLGLGLGSSSMIRNNSNGFLQNLTRDQLQAGDLITFPGHVVIYLGNGRCLEASGSGVRTSNVDWARADSFRRVPLN
jgi:cell wall-associated NlpC family hydrolase